MMRNARNNCVETISYTSFHNHRETGDLVRVQDLVDSKEFDLVSQIQHSAELFQ